jgi:hypothetical protein
LSKSLTIKTSQDVSDLSGCETFTGNIVVAADGPDSIGLDGLRTVSGNIDIENVANLRSLSSTSLESVTSFTLNALPLLDELKVPALRNFSSLKWSALPKLVECEIATGPIEGEIQEITIYNTSLGGLDWLTWPVGAVLNITANPNLESFKIPYNSINANSAITVSSNPSLNNIDVSSLSGIYGGLAISGNKMEALAFTKLESINGFVQLSGDYKNISMPALNQINGALGVESTANIQVFCDGLKEKKLVGHYDCVANAQTRTAPPTPANSSTPSATSSATTTPTSDTEASGGDSQTKAVIAGAVVGITMCLLVGFLAYLYNRRRTRKQVQEITPKDPEAGSVELSDSISDKRISLKELETPTVRLEMQAGRMVQELPAVLPSELDALDAGSGTSGVDLGDDDLSVRTVSSVMPLVRHELPA